MRTVRSFARTLKNIICVSKSVKGRLGAPETLTIHSGGSEHDFNDLDFFIAIYNTKEIRLKRTNGQDTATSKKGTVMSEADIERITLTDV